MNRGTHLSWVGKLSGKYDMTSAKVKMSETWERN